MQLGDVVDLQKLDEHIQNGFIVARPHPTLDLTIFNYTQITQNNWHWDDVTSVCRGLIVDRNTNEVVARPFKKFFSLDQLSERERSDLFTMDRPDVMEKLDGSLIILYPVPGGYACATRGSFVSDQAIAATQYWNDNFSHLNDLINPKSTLLFEWVGPSNPHVVAYPKDTLVFLGLVDNDTGRIRNSPQILRQFESGFGFTIPTIFEDVDWTTLKDLSKENFEGWVLSFGENLVKIKLDTYIRAHRLISRLTPKAVYEYLVNKDDLEVIRATLPEEHLKWFEDQVFEFTMKHGLLVTRAQDVLNSVQSYDVKDRAQRKEVASIFMQHPDLQTILFMSKMNSVPLEDSVWKAINPG